MKTSLNKIFITVFLAVCASVPSPVRAASDYFIKFDGIDGESQIAGHEGEVEGFSFKLGVSQRGITDFGGGAGATKSQFMPVVIYKNVDVASPLLFLACAQGTHIPKAELKAVRRMVDGPGQEYLTITLTDVVVSGINHESADGTDGSTILETVSLKFSKIEITYRKQNPNGTLGAPVKAGYDLKANKKL